MGDPEKSKILIVDDSNTIRQQVKAALNKFEVIEASDGFSGIEQLKDDNQISMVIADINMPNMDGFTMIKNIKSDPSINKIPIVVLSTEGGGEYIARAKKSGAKGWMVKPFDPTKLRTITKKVLNIP